MLLSRPSCICCVPFNTINYIYQTKKKKKKKKKIHTHHLGIYWVCRCFQYIPNGFPGWWERVFLPSENKEMQPLPAGKVPHNLPSRQSQPKQEVRTCQPLQTCWQIPAEKHLAQAQTPLPDRLRRTTLRSFSHYTSTDMSCSLQTAARWTLIVNCICLILHVCTCWNL